MGQGSGVCHGCKVIGDPGCGVEHRKQTKAGGLVLYHAEAKQNSANSTKQIKGHAVRQERHCDVNDDKEGGQGFGKGLILPLEQKDHKGLHRGNDGNSCTGKGT